MDMGAMARKVYSTFPTAQALLKPYYQNAYGHISAEKQSVYSTTPADWAMFTKHCYYYY